MAIAAGEQLKGGTGREGRHDFIFGVRPRSRKVIDGGWFPRGTQPLRLSVSAAFQQGTLRSRDECDSSSSSASRRSGEGWEQIDSSETFGSQTFPGGIIGRRAASTATVLALSPIFLALIRSDLVGPAR